MADQGFGIDAGQFLLPDREGDHWDVSCLHALIAELLVEWDIGVAVDRRDHRGLLAPIAEGLDTLDLGLQSEKPNGV